MYHTGKVIETENQEATVRFVRTKACEHCGACIHFGEREAQITLKNTVHAVPGDYVRVEMRVKSFLQASFLVYIVPLAALIAGIYIGSFWGDVPSILLGLCGAGLVYLILRKLDPYFSSKATFHPRMVSIEAPDETHNEPNNEHE